MYSKTLVDQRHENKLVLFKQLSLKRIKPFSNTLNLFSVFKLFRRTELLREIAPGLPPQKEVEWKSFSQDSWLR